MGGQMTELLLQVASKLDGVERALSIVTQEQRDQRREHTETLVRVAQLEQDGKWTGEERREVHGRLESGDHTFQVLQQKVNDIDRVARWCREQLQRKTTTTKHAWIWKLVRESIVPMVGSLLWIMLYHLLMAGPKIAQALKAAGEGR
ncbi:MAG TPA: hypothetical protein VG457_13010 [Planctomycetota bacterium]|jgi:hypothetical protein|nr:hypothetical protein [Planctomycetota bacterium]